MSDQLRQAAQQAVEALEFIEETFVSERDAKQEAIAALRAALSQQPATPEPVAWHYELAHRIGPSDWRIHITEHTPNVPDGAIRNLRPLVFGDAHTAPSVPDDVVRDAERYQWLRRGTGWPCVFPNHFAPEPITESVVDAAIDAAILAAKETK